MIISKWIAAVVVGAGCMVGFANGQSGSKSKPMSKPQFAPARSTPQFQPAAKQSMDMGMAMDHGDSASPTLAMDGYCPVCIVKMKKWVLGSEQHQVTYDGKIYYFPEQKQKDMFLADPAKFTPSLGGDCIVCLAKMGKRVPGSVQSASLYEGRVYMFPNEAQRAEFRANPAGFVNVDLAYGGMCSVCKVEMNKDMQGNPEIAALHNGMRYLFPGEDQRKMFLANPAKYAAR